MNEKEITKICIAVSIIGIVIIYLADVGYSAKKISGSDITGALVGERAMLCGIISDIKTSDTDTVFFKVDDGVKTSAVLFQNRATEENIAALKKGNVACITGVIEQYHSTMEIIVSKVNPK